MAEAAGSTQLLDTYEFQFLDFKGLSGQTDDWLFLGQTTLLVGRNNVGKSAVVDAIRFALDHTNSFNPEWHRHGGQSARFRVRQNLHEHELRRTFPENTHGGPIHGSHWAFGQHFLGTEVIREFDQQRSGKWIVGPNFAPLGAERHRFEQELLQATPAPNIRVTGIAAERNVQPEPPSQPEPVKPDGTGLTNLVRSFLYNSTLNMAEVEYGLLRDLNHIFESDFQFERILSRQDGDGRWEIGNYILDFT